MLQCGKKKAKVTIKIACLLPELQSQHNDIPYILCRDSKKLLITLRWICPKPGCQKCCSQTQKQEQKLPGAKGKRQESRTCNMQAEQSFIRGEGQDTNDQVRPIKVAQDEGEMNTRNREKKRQTCSWNYKLKTITQECQIFPRTHANSSTGCQLWSHLCHLLCSLCITAFVPSAAAGSGSICFKLPVLQATACSHRDWYLECWCSHERRG